MAFKSKAQRKFLWKNDPKLAEKFEKETPSGAKLPDRVTKPSSKIKKVKKI